MTNPTAHVVTQIFSVSVSRYKAFKSYAHLDGFDKTAWPPIDGKAIESGAVIDVTACTATSTNVGAFLPENMTFFQEAQTFGETRRAGISHNTRLIIVTFLSQRC